MSKTSREPIRLDQTPPTPVDVARLEREVTDWDRERFTELISVSLTPQQREWALVPQQTFPRQTEVLAVHWHPEFIPAEVIEARIAAMYPNREDSLIIPTQHNVLLTWHGYAGVEVDCYAHGFNSKVQLLLHFKAERLTEKADVLKAMLAHTFKYRSSQLFEFLKALTDEHCADLRRQAATRTGAEEEMIDFCAIYASRLRRLLEDNWTSTPEEMIKNKLVRNYFEALKVKHGARYISRVQVYLKAVKELVKDHFSLKYFYRASEVIEEARSLGAGVVIPHPEQFWPILLADYDVDGVEVWNPQSSKYTEFLINVINRQNRCGAYSRRPLLVFMGDDCHMGEKVLPPENRDPEKGSREIGFQPAWDDMSICKSLIVGNISRSKTIREYKARLE